MVGSVDDLAAGVGGYLNRLLADSDERARLKQAVLEAKARGRDFLRDLGIDPQQDAAYVETLAAIATAFTASDLSGSSERLEGPSGELVSRSDELISETKTLKWLTAVLALLTVVLVLRTFWP